jgi:parallel beta-helix repeat protein
VPTIHLDPKTYSEESLRAAIAQLAHSGGTVYLPPQTLILNDSLVLSNNLSLVGAPGSELIFRTSHFGVIIQGSAEQPAHGIQLQHLILRHEGEQRFSAAVFITHAHDIIVRAIEIHHPLAGGFLLADGVYRVQMFACSVFHAGLTGFMLVRDVADCLLHECRAEYCMQGGIFLTDLVCPPEIAALDFDAQIHHTLRVIKNFAPFAADDPAPQRNTLQNCIFSRNRKMGITTDGTGNLRILNCVIAENDCEGITLDNGSWYCEVRNNHIYANGWRGLQHEVELSEDFVAKMGLLADGSSKAKLPGVSLDNAAYCRIEGNLIEKNWGDGVKFVRAVYACTVANNIISHNNQGVNDQFHFFGVLVGNAERQHPQQSDFASCYNRIIDNDIIGAHYAGIHLLPGTHANLMRGNHISGATHLEIEDHAVSNKLLGDTFHP